ncbi:MAG: RsfS/YbeB/iojap family protein, partial [Myxococcales bacterium]|nr:RsfS/YbeB/iojap family protein [Myxococcales bacterium]
EVRQKLKHDLGLLPVGVEGLETGKWVLLDFGDVVLHVFHEGARAFYDLEGLWGDAERLPVPEGHGAFGGDERPLFTLP